MIINPRLQVANFCSAEDDGSFWSRWIKPDAIAPADVRTHHFFYITVIIIVGILFLRS